MTVSWAWAPLLATSLTSLALAATTGEYCGYSPLPQQDAYILGASWGEDSEVTDRIDACHVQNASLHSYLQSCRACNSIESVALDLAGRSISRSRLLLASYLLSETLKVNCMHAGRSDYNAA